MSTIEFVLVNGAAVFVSMIGRDPFVYALDRLDVSMMPLGSKTSHEDLNVGTSLPLIL